MSSTISEAFGELGLTISKEQIVKIEKATIHFLLRGSHPLTFNGMLLGVYPIAFKTSDYNELFDIFQMPKSKMEEAIKSCPAIDRTFVVTSDPYNLLIFWLCHLAHIYIKNSDVRKSFQTNLLRLFAYKLFCSVVNNSFRYGSVEGIQLATINSLSRKSDIIRYESWGKLIDAHVEKILDTKDRFYKTIEDGYPDDLFLRAISESQTALRAKVVTFANAYYEIHASGDGVKFKSAISENADGERIIAQTASVIESAQAAMVSEILNANMFVHEISINDVASMFTTISPRMLKTTLLKINEEAVLQAAAQRRTFDKVETHKDGTTLYIGVRVLVIEIIRSMIRMCREKKVNMGDRALVFKTVKDAMTSSRNLDPDVAAIKNSVGHLIEPFNITSNAASQSALRLAVIFYLAYRVVQKLK